MSVALVLSVVSVEKFESLKNNNKVMTASSGSRNEAFNQSEDWAVTLWPKQSVANIHHRLQNESPVNFDLQWKGRCAL